MSQYDYEMAKGMANWPLVAKKKRWNNKIMIMKGKILEIDPTGSWEGQHGTMHTYSIKLEMMDGLTIRGEANAKSNNVEDLPYKVGEEVEFEHEEAANPAHPDKLKIKKEGQSSYSGSKAKGNNRSFALSYAKDIAVALIGQGGKIKKSEIIEIADTFVTWLDS